MLENTRKFIDGLAASLHDGTFVKLTLGNYKGPDEHLQKLLVRLVNTKKGMRLFFLYRGDTRDTVKNYEFKRGQELIAKGLDGDFFSGHLFTTSNDLQLEIGKKGKSRLNISKPTFSALQSSTHDRKKRSQVDPGSFYLKALGITDDTGRVRDREQNKWRQINKFVEVLASLVNKSELRMRSELRIVDMGSGKGYLTFAAYDYFRNSRNSDVLVTGVDTKHDLVDLGNRIAAASGFEGLNFVLGTIADYDVGGVDVLIALHACDTATDDAIYKGIAATADLIVVAPCCHQEIRPQIKPPEMFRDILKHGVMLERVAETMTDGLRSLLLERSGYSTKLFEFVGTEHTPKNNMLVGTRTAAPRPHDEVAGQIKAIKTFYNIREHHLEKLLDGGRDLSQSQKGQDLHMQSKASTPEDYIAELPEERQQAVSALRDEINRNLPEGFQETMGYGMMGWVVPHSLFPPGYHCDPKQPLPFMGIGSQKNYISIYHMGLYSDPELLSWFREAWEEAGVGKLDMGKSCIRLKKTASIPLALIGQLATKMTPAAWVELYQASLK